jgi:hypothetical protein
MELFITIKQNIKQFIGIFVSSFLSPLWVGRREAFLRSDGIKANNLMKQCASLFLRNYCTVHKRYPKSQEDGFFMVATLLSKYRLMAA